MADLALGAMKRIVTVGLKIKKALETVQQNKEECRDIQRCVASVTALLPMLKAFIGPLDCPALSVPLDDLADSMDEALLHITDCQQKSALRHLLGAANMGKKLGRVRNDIQSKQMTVLLVASIRNLQISVSVENTLHYVAGGINSYNSNLNAVEMRSGVSSNTTMVATGNAGPYTSSSRLAEFNWCEDESTLHLSSEEHVSEVGHALVLKQKIVIRVQMKCSKCRSKAMALVADAGAGGVDSVAIAGAGMDQVVVVGLGVDSIKLTSVLRRKMGGAQLVEIGEA